VAQLFSLGVLSHRQMPRTSIRTMQTALETWESGLARLGECISNFQRLEDSLSRCISGMIGRDRHAGAIVTVEMSYRAKVAVFGALFRYRFGSADLPEDVSELFGRLRDAEQRRNSLVHSMWDVSVKQPTTIKREKSACRKSGLVRDLQHMTPDELEEAHEIFEGIEKDLFYLTCEHLPKIAKRIR